MAFTAAGEEPHEAVRKADDLAREFCKEHGHTGQQAAHVEGELRRGFKVTDTRRVVPAKPCERCGQHLSDPFAHMAYAPTPNT